MAAEHRFVDFAEHGFVEYGLLRASDAEEMVRLLATAFSAAEPPAVAMGLSYDELARFVSLLAPRAIADGLTAVARTRAGEVAGVMLTDDFGAPAPIPLDRISSKFRPILALLDTLDAQYRDGKNIAPGEHLHLFMLAVDARHAGRGIAQGLVETCLANGRKKGYRHALTEATGAVSQRVFRKLGFEERYRVSYQDYRHDGEAVFASISGHPGAALMERTLR
jgi:ribosomal protein S18 acetylase RimI-like enzyme